MSKKENNRLDLNVVKDNLLRGTQIDIYGDDYDTEIHAGKYYIHLYNELCCTYVVNTNINLKSFIDELNEKFDLTKDNYLLRNERAENNEISKIDYAASYYLIKIKEKILLEVFNHRQVIFYSPDYEYKHFGDLIKLIETSREKKRIERKILYGRFIFSFRIWFRIAGV